MARLERFRSAQNSPHAGFESALHEIRTGGKRSHWIWYIFPQLSGLGTSGLSETFAIANEEEAIAFLQDAELRDRLLTITGAVADQLSRGGGSLRAVMGSDVDARKIVSSLTLFREVARHLYEVDKNETFDSIANAAGEVLIVAASQGYPACAYTLRRLGETRPRRGEQ